MPSSPKDNPEFLKKIQVLHEKYRQGLPGKYEEIQTAWENYRANPADEELYDTFYRVVHTFKGTSSTFGFMKLADVCLDIQMALTDIKEGHPVDSAMEQRITLLLETFKARMDEPADMLPV